MGPIEVLRYLEFVDSGICTLQVGYRTVIFRDLLSKYNMTLSIIY
jgi:hypothetical protein